MLLKDWTRGTLCGKLVQGYLDNIDSDHSIFTVLSQQLDQIASPLEAAADTLLEMNGVEDDNYTQAIGLVRLSRQLEAGLAELSFLAEHEGRERLREEYRSSSLFFQSR
jgi:hypothetical protein